MDSSITQGKDQLNPVQLLLQVVDNGNAKSLAKVLQRQDLNLDGANKHGERAMHIAAGYGKLDFVKMLHEAGAQLDITDKQGDTPLYWASRHGHSEVVHYLCSNGVDVNHQDKFGETAALVASRYTQPEVLKVLCQFQANLDLQDKEGESPLLCACWHDFQTIVEQLVQSGCSLSIRNQNGETPLHIAAVRGSSFIVRYVCEHGAETNPVSLEGHTPLILATRRNHLDIVQYLCEQHCDLNAQDKNGDTALHEACKEDQLSLVYTLCASGANLDLTNIRGMTPVHVAATNGHTEVVRFLCSSGCKLNTANRKGETPDVSAANVGHHELSDMIRVLKQVGMRDRCLDELTLGSTKLNRVRLLVCGGPGVGKTTLISSLRTKFLRTLRRHTFGGSYLGSAALDHTYGFCVQQITIPGAGEFSAWDFSGRKEYYPAHEFFLDCKNGIYLVVYNSTHLFETQLAQVRFWLAMIKSKHRPNAFIHFAGHYGQKPFVILVSSFTDAPPPPPAPTQTTSSLSSGSGFEEEDDFTATSPLSDHVKGLKTSKLNYGPYGSSRSNLGAQEKKGILQCVVEEFGDHFMFTDTVFHIDCRQPRGRETSRLRTVLGTLRESVLKVKGATPGTGIITLDPFSTS